METTISPKKGTEKEQRVIGSVRIVESEVRVQVPVFEDVKIVRPIFVEETVKVPVGYEAVMASCAEEISKLVIAKVEKALDNMIAVKMKELKATKLVEEIVIKHKDVIVERPIFKDVTVDRVSYRDKEILNPVLVDKPIVNAIITDKEVTNAILKDKVVVNPIYEDVIITRPKFVEKEVTAIHLKYVDPKGNPE